MFILASLFVEWEVALKLDYDKEYERLLDYYNVINDIGIENLRMILSSHDINNFLPINIFNAMDVRIPIIELVFHNVPPTLAISVIS